MPALIDQIMKALKIMERTGTQSNTVADPTGSKPPEESEVGRTAILHGAELLERGFTIDQVVHGYGDLCQTITELMFEKELRVGVQEFQTLNGCLDTAIAGAVMAFAQLSDKAARTRRA